MKLYFKIILNIVIVLTSFGLILPFLISYPSTLTVVAGFVYALLVLPLVLYRINRSIVAQIMESLK